MSWSDVVTRPGGSGEFALLIHGIGYLWTTGGTWPSTISGVTGTLSALDRTLKTESIKWQTEVDPKDGEVKHSNMTFYLVDGIDGSTRYAVSDLLGRNQAGANVTEARATLAAGTAPSYTVDDTSAFASSGDIYVDQETLEYTSTTATTFDRAVTLVRGKYGSADARHTYSLDVGDMRSEGDLISLVSDRPIHVYGRHCTLYFAEANADGTLATPEVRYRGRIMGSVNLTDDGATWEVPTESVWEAIDSEIPSRDASAQVRGITFQNGCRFDWQFDIGGGGLSGDFTMATLQWNNGDELMREFVRLLNADLIGAGADETVHADGPGESGGWIVSLTDGLVADSILRIIPANMAWARALGFVEEGLGLLDFQITTLGNSYPTPAVAGIFPAGIGPMTVYVSDASPFAVVDIDDPPNSVRIQGRVYIGNVEYELFDVDAGANTLRISMARGEARMGDPRYLYRPGEEPLMATEVLFMGGSWWQLWKRLIEEDTIPQEWRGYLETAAFDWAGIEEAAASGPDMTRHRVLFRPESFRDLWMSDLAIEGLLPTIASGLISALPMAHPIEAESDLTLDEDVIRAVSPVGWVVSEERIINQLVYRWRWDWIQDDWVSDGVVVNDRTAQQRYADPNKREIENKGLAWFVHEDVEGLFANTMKFFSLFGRPYPVISLECTIRAGDLLPGDTVVVTAPRIPDLTSGTRGVTGLRCLVLGVEVMPFEDPQTKVKLLQITDGIRRSGFAPAAQLATYVDNGGGAGDTQHEITLTTGVYDDRNEGLNFAAVDKVVLYQFFNDTATTEIHTVSPTLRVRRSI
jgi:hypothetical protein